MWPRRGSCLSARAAQNTGIKFLSPHGSDIVLKDVEEILSRSRLYADRVAKSVKDQAEHRLQEHVNWVLHDRNKNDSKNYAGNIWEWVIPTYRKCEENTRNINSLNGRIAALEAKVNQLGADMNNKVNKRSVIKLRNKAKADAFNRSEPHTSL